jgi:hypothetical protein
MSYVVAGTRLAVVIHHGFACTKEELPRALATYAMARGSGLVLRHEVYSSRAAAEAAAADYNYRYGHTWIKPERE